MRLNSAIYIIDPKRLEESLDSTELLYYKMSEEESINIDTQLDLDLARLIDQKKRDYSASITGN